MASSQEAFAQFTLPPVQPTGSASAASTSPGAAGPQSPRPVPIAEADPATRKREALRLIAVGRAAMDRGDYVAAVESARRAQSLNVPERQFAADEPRVWQLLLDAESSARRAGIDVSAIRTPPAPTPGGISQAGFNAAASPAGDTVAQVQSIQPIPTNGSPEANRGSGEALYQEGLKALSAGNQQLAREKFTEAWKYESSMDLATRRQLKEKLTLMPTRLPPARMTGAAPMTAIKRAELESQQQVQRLYREVTTELAAINEIKTSDPLGAQEQLDRLMRRVDGAAIDDGSKRSLASLVGRAVADQKAYVEANRANISLDLQNDAVRMQLATEMDRNIKIEKEVSSLVDQFNDLMDQRRFHEAEVVAKQVSELKPDDPIAVSMAHSSRMGIRLQLIEEIQEGQEEYVFQELNSIERRAIGINPEQPIEYDDPIRWADMSTQRLGSSESDSGLSPAEREIKQKLGLAISANYVNRPLAEVLQDISSLTGIPIHVDRRALAETRVSLDAPITFDYQQRIPTKSVLNLILQDFGLAWIIDNDVLSITSRDVKRANVITRTYRVTDLVTPIPNFTGEYEQGLAGAMRAAYQRVRPQASVNLMPVSATGLGAGMAQGETAVSMNPAVMGQINPMGIANGYAGPTVGNGNRGGGAFADFDSLIQLIQSTVEVDSWDAVGGQGTIQPYQQNLSLVISNTSEVHDEIIALLESLRKLQNLQITIEVRFITLSDTFFEQIGVDFDVQFDDNVGSLPDDDSGASVSIGWDQNLPTADLDIAFNNNSFGLTPPFGAPDPGAISTLGFAILSDIEAFFFLQAAQGDSRSNVMQAPKVTLFDGQVGSINDTVQRPFVTGIIPVVGDFAVAQQPVIVILNEGTQLNVQGVVSDDKRYVRLTLVPFFSQIGEVNTFTYDGSRTTNSGSRDEDDTNGDGVVDDEDAVDETNETEVTTGSTVQLPTFASTSVQTTVSVPDGGTILLGGIKRMSEGRQERGVPVLSKIPYVSRLFRNVSTGRTANSLMMMVTPRIIIQEEEEVSQTGFNPNN